MWRTNFRLCADFAVLCSFNFVLCRTKLNIPTLLGACQENLHWAECVFLYSHYDQYDNAVNVLIEHSAECWEHELFKQTIKQVTNTEVYYKGASFYLEEHPLLLNDLLMDVHQNLDHTKVNYVFSCAYVCTSILCGSVGLHSCWVFGSVNGLRCFVCRW